MGESLLSHQSDSIFWNPFVGLAKQLADLVSVVASDGYLCHSEMPASCDGVYDHAGAVVFLHSSVGAIDMLQG